MKFDELWRPVETGDADKMEFCRGDGKPSFWIGGSILATGLAMFILVLLESRDLWNEILELLRFQMYEAALCVYAVGCMFSLAVLKYFFMGVWMIFGRTRVVLDRVARTITKEYRLGSFCLFFRSYQVGDSFSFSFRRKIRSFAPFHSISLSDEKNRRLKLLVVPRNFVNDGWAMAEQMAAFLSIPLLADGK